MPVITRNILPSLLIIASVWIFFGFISPTYEKIQELRGAANQYQTAIDNTNEVRILRNKLLATYDSISEDDKEKLFKLLPEKVDIIKLMLDLEGIAKNFGIRFDDIDVDDSKISQGGEGRAAGAGTIGFGGGAAPDAEVVADQALNSGLAQKYDVIKVSFSFKSEYQNFLQFLRTLEMSLQLVDVVAVEIKGSDQPASQASESSSPGSSTETKADVPVHQYVVTLHTYKLK